MSFDYEFLSHPLPDEFREWYPYDKAESWADQPDEHWLRGMRRVTGDELPGLKHTFVVARDSGTGEYAGVCWLCESESTPELAHFGWFLIAESYRGKGAGRGILDRAIELLEGRGVEMIMLPTQTTTVHARCMYSRRGFRDLMVEEGAVGCWMVRAQEGHYERYFTRRGEVEIVRFEPCDYIAFDYLVNGGEVQSKLHPLGLIGTKRIVSFKPTWEGACELLSARDDRKLVGVGTLRAVDNRTSFDVLSHDPAVAEALVDHILGNVSGELVCHVARGDAWKREVVERAGLLRVDVAQATAPGGHIVEFDVFVR